MCGCNFSTSKGSFTVDASLALPVFILSIALLLSLIYEAGEEDALYKKLAKDANAASAVLGTVDIEVPFMIAIGKTKTRGIERELYYRPFYGESAEVRNHDITVYIFPKYGKKYHIAGCSTMERNPSFRAVPRSQAVSMGYTECHLCGLGWTDYFKKDSLRPPVKDR